jgi:hypothetical protein
MKFLLKTGKGKLVNCPCKSYTKVTSLIMSLDEVDLVCDSLMRALVKE